MKVTAPGELQPSNTMGPINRRIMNTWMRWGTRVLPFADVASPTLPLSRLLACR